MNDLKRIPKFLKRSLGRVVRLPELGDIEPLEKIGESLTPNMRALRLSLMISEKLLSMGVSARDVVYMAEIVMQTYCRRPASMDVSSTIITVSQDRGNDREPLTLIRKIVPDYPNYQLIQSLQQLVLTIRDSHLPLEKAESELEQILASPRKHPEWLLCVGGGTLSAGVVVQYGAGPIVTILAFVIGFMATALLGWLGRRGMATFFLQIFVALIITMTAASVAWANTAFDLTINPTLLVIGGIVLLVAGMMIVGAFQDAIDEYYVTANARLLKVMMATGGIVIGVILGLYVATKFGIGFPATPDRLTMTENYLQYIGALGIAAGLALWYHARLTGVVVAGLVGMFGWWAMVLLETFNIGDILASGIAAAVIGLLATSLSRLWRIPSIAIISAGIVPLVPGLLLYNGLIGVVQNPTTDPAFMLSVGLLSKAVMIGVAVATGASIGSMIGRPIRHRVRKWIRG